MRPSILRRGLAVLAGAGTVVPLTAALAAPAAAAPPTCADYTFIGVAGSGEGHEAGGMGDTVHAAAASFAQRVRDAGETVSIRAVHYPAASVPTSPEAIGPFLASMNTGAANTQGDYDIVVKACPDTKVVLVGYSQGAAGVHRALQRLGDRKQIAAAALIADPDRITGDTTRDLGSAGPSRGMAQAAALVAGADPAPLPPALGRRTLSVCNTGDPVCQWTGDLLDVQTGSHDSYSGSNIGGRLATLAGV